MDLSAPYRYDQREYKHARSLYGKGYSLEMRLHAVFTIWIAAVSAFGCSRQEAECKVRSSSAALINGHSRADFLRLEPRQERAVVQILLAGAMLCSGVLVAERVVLTARHCVSDSDHDVLEVMFGADRNDDDSFVLGAHVLAVHPVVDLAALALDATPRDQRDIEPLPVAPALPTGTAADTLVQIAGYGYQADVRGQRSFLVEHVEQLGSDHVVVSADSLAGACFGDSGGPLLMRDDAGRVRTLALLDEGTGDCRGEDRYTRIDVLADWLAKEAGVSTDELLPGLAYPALGSEGRCFGALAAWYGAGELHGRVCAEGVRCGWDTEAGGYRCIEPSADACGGVDDVGACSDGNAVRCDRGEPQINPCATCGFTCMRSPKTGLPVCLDAR